MKIWIFVFYGSLLGIFTGANDDAPKRIVCYFSRLTGGYKRPFDYGPRDIPTQLCTDVVFASITFGNETFEIEIPHDSDVLHQFTALGSSSSGPSFFLGVGGESDDSSKWSTMVSYASKRSAFVASALRLVRERGFNGLDLNWKYPKAQDRENFVKLVEELERAFKPFGLLLTSTVYLGEIVLNIQGAGYDIPRLAELLDWMNVVTSNLRGPWNDFVDVPSPLYRRPFDVDGFKYLNVHDAMEILGSLGALRRKLVVGVSFVGRSYTLGSSSATYLAAPVNTSVRQGDPGPVTNSKWFLAYYEICRMVSTAGKWIRRFDHVGKCPYAFHGDQWVGYDDEQSIRIKMDYVRNRGYGGAYVWAVNFDDFNGFCGSQNPLLHTVHEALSKKKDEQTIDSTELMLRKRYEAMGIVPTCSA